VALLVLAGVAVAAIGGFVLLSNDDSSDGDHHDALDGDDALSVVRTFDRADADFDCETMIDLLTPTGMSDLFFNSDPDEAMANCLNLAERFTKERTLHAMEIESDSEQGEENVTVNVVATTTLTELATGEVESDTYEQHIYLVYENGRWLIDGAGGVRPTALD
jgi:hypothetical protein